MKPAESDGLEDGAWCASCAKCKWWNGTICRQEGINFRDCPEYGKSFVMEALCKDKKTGRAVLIPLKRGQLPEDLMKSETKTRAPSANAAPTGGVNIFDF